MEVVEEEQKDEFKKPEFIMPAKSKGSTDMEFKAPAIPNLPKPEPPAKEIPENKEGHVKPKSVPTLSAEQKKAKYAAMLSQLKYKAPKQSAAFDSNYGLEVLKNGSVIDRIRFNSDRSFYVIGRSPGCDIVNEHLTFSRMHAVFQWIGQYKRIADVQPDQDEEPQIGTDSGDIGMEECNEKGLYIYDLDSTHGTFLNKNQIYPKRYYRLRVGHVLKFGSSSRLFIVCGPPEDEEEESEKTVTELLKERLDKEFERKREMEMLKARGNIPVVENVEEEGISWGMAEDAVEEPTDLSINPFAANFESTETNFDNPKKTLLGWFEREGYSDELVYDVREKAVGHFICRINLPLDGPGGVPVFAEVDAKGKKKEVVAQCALKACQLLDKYGVLRQSHREGFKRKMKDWEEKDYYSSDEDTFLDRTGSVEKKRTVRMARAGKIETKTETYESLSEKCKGIETEIENLGKKIAKAESDKLKDDDEVDPLDAFMQHIKTGATDIGKMKTKLKELTEELKQAKKLMHIASPSAITLPKNLSGKTPKGKLAVADAFDVISPPIKSEKVEPDIKVKSEEDVSPISKKMKLNEPTPSSISTSGPETKSERIPSQMKTVKPEVSDNAEGESSGTSAALDEELEFSKAGEGSEEILKAKRKRNRFHPQKKIPSTATSKPEYDFNKPEYSDWVPPTDQRGDGWTKLNEKLGY